MECHGILQFAGVSFAIQEVDTDESCLVAILTHGTKVCAKRFRCQHIPKSAFQVQLVSLLRLRRTGVLRTCRNDECCKECAISCTALGAALAEWLEDDCDKFLEYVAAELCSESTV